MKALPDGIYLNLRDETYFAQDRLGSTDLVTLHDDPASWWYGSRYNPDRHEREITPEMQFGSAMHVLLLEGEAAYAERVAIRPSTYIDAKTGEEKPWNGNANVCKAWMDEHDLPGAIIITEDADRRVRHMVALIQYHPELGGPMKAGLSEVAVLWTNDQGVKLRAKFDKLLPRFTVDLKTFGGDAKGMTIKQQCTGLVAKRHMDVQRYLYFQARNRMAELVAAGAVFGGTKAEREWVGKVAAVEDWRWCWIFYRRRDDRARAAPIVQPIFRSHYDVTMETGRLKVEVALANHAAFMKRFGPSVPWAVIEAGWEPVDHEFPSWLSDVREPVTFPGPEQKAA